MKKYLVLVLMLVISSVSYGARTAASSQQKNMYGERNEFTTDDPCQAPNVVGCGPCFKACMAQHHGDGALKTNITFGANPTRGGAKAGVSGQ